jgi:L-2-hydroxyglutarate oxidase
MFTADITIVGAGVVGLATAYQLTRKDPTLRIIVVEKESQPAAHQTGRNSGVIHSGIYYKPGSLKAKLCHAGRTAMVEFCRAEEILHDVCGKVVVALSEGDLQQLDVLAERAQSNGVRATRIDRKQLQELEPHAAGLAALHVPDTGIVDYRQVCERYIQRLTQRPGSVGAGSVFYSTQVRGVSRRERSIVVHTTTGNITTGRLVNCAGLQSDRVARLLGQDPKVCIVPFKGEYYELLPEARGLIRNLIYPVPDPAFPFLGVHFTRMIEGGVECGPNAVLAMGREAYEPWQPDIEDLISIFFGTPGFWKFAAKHWRAGFGEFKRSLSKPAFVRALQRLVPDIKEQHLVTAAAGIRAQAMAADGKLVDDFVFSESPSVLSVCNAPSPAATASLAIAQVIADRVLAMAD